MFRPLGQFIIKHKFIVLAAWLVAAAWMATMAPSLKDVAVSETSAFLPPTAPSMLSQQMIVDAFPQEGNMGAGLLVIARAGGLSEADRAFARALSEWLASPAAPAVVQDVASLFTQPGTESLFLSPNGSTMLVTIGFETGPYEESSIAAVDAIRRHIAASAPPQGLDVHLTGASAISGDQRTALFEGVDRTTAATIVLVILILLVIYRSPVAALAPLMTIGVAYMVGRGVLAYLGANGWQISSFVDAFIVVLVFGVGTDYCLFILSRFREELGRRSSRDESIVVTMSAIGAVITASAATVIVALTLMATGDFAMMQTMGPAMAIAVFVTLLAGLTLTPAIVAIMGRHLFWPRHDEVQHDTGGAWQRIAEIATTRYRLVAVVVVLVLLVPYLALPQLNQVFDMLSELPKETDSVQGFDALARGFDSGELLPVTVLLTASQGKVLDHLAQVDQTARALEAMPQVQRVRSLLQPTGDEQTAAMFRVDSQLTQAADGMGALAKALDDPKSMTGQPSSGQGNGMGDLGGFLAELGALPAVSSKPSFGQAKAQATAVDAGLSRLNEATRVSVQLDGIGRQMAQLAQALKNPAGLASGGAADPAADLQDMATYLMQLGQVQPTLAREASFQEALAALRALGDDLSKLQEALLVTNQLGLLAQQLQELGKALSTPMGLLALSGSADQMTLLAGYYVDLGKALPALATDPAYQSILARLVRLDALVKALARPGADLATGLADLKKEVDGLAADTLGLQQAVGRQNAKATFTPQNLQALSGMQTTAGLPDPAKPAQRLADSLAQLAATAKAQMPTATFLPTGIPLNAEMRQALDKLKQDALALQATLNRLANETGSGQPIYFLPAAMSKDERAASLINYFVSADGKSARLIVVLKARPYSPQASKDVHTLLPLVEQMGQVTGLRAIMGGAPVILNDVQETLARDFSRISLFTIVGVLIVLIILLRSLVAPIYLVLTVLLSYGTTMGLSVLVFQDLLGQEGVTFMIPIIVFVLLVALGADYNIFLMSRVREEAEGRGTRKGIRVASAFTGSIITSCGIILAGTFAAMMVAPIQTLFQVGFAVAAGVLIDTFIIRAVLVPALASWLDEKNWWPGKIRGA